MYNEQPNTYLSHQMESFITMKMAKRTNLWRFKGLSVSSISHFLYCYPSTIETILFQKIWLVSSMSKQTLCQFHNFAN